MIGLQLYPSNFQSQHQYSSPGHFCCRRDDLHRRPISGQSVDSIYERTWFTKTDEFLHQPRLDWEMKGGPQHDPSPRENSVPTTSRRALPPLQGTSGTPSTGQYITPNDPARLTRCTTSAHELYFQRVYNVDAGDLLPYSYNDEYKPRLMQSSGSSRYAPEGELRSPMLTPFTPTTGQGRASCPRVCHYYYCPAQPPLSPLKQHRGRPELFPTRRRHCWLVSTISAHEVNCVAAMMMLGICMNTSYRLSGSQRT